MKTVFQGAPLVLLIAGLMQSASLTVPVYFLPADSQSFHCTVLNQASTRISSDRLELGSGGREIDFLNAQPGVPCQMAESEDRLSVFIGSDPAKWRSNLPISRRIRYRSVYPGIDLVYYGNLSRLEYDFEVAPGASPSRIGLGFARNARLKISSAGDLLISVNGSPLIQRRPRASQGGREVAAKYVIDKRGKQVRIELGPYDHSQPLTIDPVLAWEVSANGSGSAANTVAADGAGNMWILDDFPGANLTYTKTFGAGGAVRDVMLLKVDPAGSQLLYAVLLGGSAGAIGSAVAIDAAGNAYVTGSTSSTDLPVTANAFQNTMPSVYGSAFVTKISPQGDSLVYSTYLGGVGGASGSAIAVDPSGNAFVGGTAGAQGFPLTNGSWEGHFGIVPLGGNNALQPIAGGFVTKLNTTGTALLYSTLIDQFPVGLTLNSAGAAYAVGEAIQYATNLDKFTLAVGDTTGNGTVVTRLTLNGGQADLSVFLGCFEYPPDNAGLLALDSKSNILVAGSSPCPTFPVGTSGAFQPQHSPGYPMPLISPTQLDDGLIVKIAPDGSSVLAATFLGGGDTDEITAINVASDDSVLVTGGTSSNNFPVTGDALQPKYGGGAIPQANVPGDGFFSHFSSNLNQLVYSTYLGGTGADYMSAMALDLANNAYLGGFSISGLETPGVFSFGSPGALWALKLAQDMSPPPVISSVSPATLTAGSPDSMIQLTGANFASSALVLLGGSSLSTTFQGSTQVSAVVNAASLATSGSLELRVLNPASGASNLWALPVIAAAGNNPTPQIDSLLPSGLTAGSSGQNIIVTGTGFIGPTTAAIDGNARAASLNTDNTLSVALTDADLSSPGTLSLTLTNPAPGGGSSQPASFLVAPGLVPAQPPGLGLIVPSSEPAGTAATTITVTASRVSPSSVARWNGVEHALSMGTDGNFTFTASASDLAHAGTVEVTIYDKANGLESNPLPFWIPFTGIFTDMAWNAASGQLYLAGTNSLIILDPGTGNVIATVPLDIQPSRLVVSPEGSYVYAATSDGTLLRRYQLLSAAPWLGTSLDLALNGLVDFAPVPGSPGSVAVVTNGPFQSYAAIYDGAVERAATAQLPHASTARALVFSNDGTTLHYAVELARVGLATMPVTSAGVGPAVTQGTISFEAQPATYFQGRVYTSLGEVFDAATLTKVGEVPASSNALPLASSQAIIMLDTSGQYTCVLEAFDPTTFLPLWEEHTLGGCSVNSYPYSNLFDIGGGRIAFRMTNAYIVQEPAATPLQTIQFFNNPLTATVEIGTNWGPQNDLGIISPEITVPITGYFYPNQPGILSLTPPASSFADYVSLLTPASVSLLETNYQMPLGNYTGNMSLLLSNSTNPPIVASYNLSIVNPYPLQASVSSLAFVWHPGDAPPASQSFSLTKQGKPLPATVMGSYPNWLTVQNSGNGPPETITVSVHPSALAAGIYTASLTFGYYSSPVPLLVVPVTLTVLGPPSISSVQDAESANLTVVPGEWVAIYGTNLATASRTWAANDFGSGKVLPTMLDGVSVQFGQTPAAVYYVSPTQIDAQVPSGVSGTVPVTVTFDGTTSSTSNATIGQNAPSLFVYHAGTNLYPAATHANGSLIGDPAVQPGTSKASPGEPIVLYVNGLASSPGGVLISAPMPYTDPVIVAIGTQQAVVAFAGLVAAGQFQINVTVPADLAPGNYTIVVTAGGQVSPGVVILPVQ